MPNRLLPAFLLGLACCTGALGCRPDVPSVQETAADTTRTRTESLAALVARTPSLSAFHDALRTSGLDETLEALGPFTVFAPKDEALARRPFLRDTTLSEEAQRDTLRRLLALHLMRGRIEAGQVQDSLTLSTLADRPITLRRTSAEAPLRVEGLTIERSLVARNGVLHVLRGVLTPSDTTDSQDSPLF